MLRKYVLIEKVDLSYCCCQYASTASACDRTLARSDRKLGLLALLENAEGRDTHRQLLHINEIKIEKKGETA